MCFPERLTGKEKRKTIFRRLLWVGLSVTDAGLLCVSESWALSGVLFLRLPRKSEIATGWSEVEGGKSEGSQARRDGGGGQETDDQAHLLTRLPPPSSSLLPRVSLLCSSFPLLTSLCFPPLPLADQQSVITTSISRLF